MNKNIISLSILILLGCQSIPNPQPSDVRLLDTQGHRGARGLKPENTWPAFQEALNYNMTTLELDTVLTKDGVPVIHHDTETNPLICQKKDGSPIQKVSIYELTFSELKQLDCGSKKNPKYPEQIPVPGTELISLEELFSLVAKEEASRKKKGLPPVLFNIETKFPDNENTKVPQEKVQTHVRAILNAVEKAKLTDRITIQSFYLPALVEAKKQNPKIQTAALFAPTRPQGLWMLLGGGSGYRKDIIQKAKEVNADIISPYFLYVDKEFMFLSRKEGLKVIPWTVNDKKEMRRLISLGVDGIITDYPNRLMEVIKEF